MAAGQGQGTSASAGVRVEDRLARTVEALRERRLRRAQLSGRVRRAPGDEDFGAVVDAAMAAEAATAQARGRRAGHRLGSGS